MSGCPILAVVARVGQLSLLLQSKENHGCPTFAAVVAAKVGISKLHSDALPFRSLLAEGGAVD